jgi:tetratricopeptide (TPR) repeat protein
MNPLIALSQLEDYVKKGDFAHGWAFYQNLEHPTALEDQLGGKCLWGQGLYEEAKIPLYRAVQRGQLSAAVDLIAIHLQLNEFTDAQGWVETSQQLDLSSREQVRVLMFHGDLLQKMGQVRLTINILKKAWLQANLLDEDVYVTAQVAQSLAAALHDVGRDREALRYLNRVIRKTEGVWNTFLRITRAYASIGSGDEEQARLDLLETEHSSQQTPFLMTYRLIVTGFHMIAHRQTHEAMRQLELAVHNAEQIDLKEFQVTSAALLCAVYASHSSYDKARAVLMPLTNLDLSPAEEAIRQLRIGQLHAASRDLEGARIALESAVATFSTLERQRELSWALLRLAHLHLERGDRRLANQTLERVSDIANAIGGTIYLLPELNLMGLEVVKQLAEIASPYAMHALLPVVEPDKSVTVPLESRPLVRRLRIVTLGKPQLLADDRNVSPRLNKAMELISYLILHPQTSLERIVHDVFPDSDAKAGANYFHQLRHRITKDVPELRVVQDKQTKAYTLDTGTVPLESDYEDVIKLLNHATQNELHQALELYRGAFMPHLESEWAEEVRNNVEWLLVRSGLRIVQDLYERGDFEDCRKLTEKLRKVAPLDEGLSELLVRATNEIDGLLAARRTLSDVEKYFHSEVGELPPALENLKREIKFNLN